MSQTSFKITGMRCQSCVSKIQSALARVDGVDDVRVSLDPPSAEIQSEQLLSHDTIANVISQAGDYLLVADHAGERGDIVNQNPTRSWIQVYQPLLIVVGFILSGSVLLAFKSGQWGAGSLMSDFMGLFFVGFAFFKLLDLPAFATAYQSYDLVAARLRVYGFVYPFVELGLGVCYLLRIAPFATNVITLVLMLIGSAGVGISLYYQRKIQCACLGTVFDLPMTTVTLVENMSMALMALWMLWAGMSA